MIKIIEYFILHHLPLESDGHDACCSDLQSSHTTRLLFLHLSESIIVSSEVMIDFVR